jgi:hypothetical protein
MTLLRHAFLALHFIGLAAILAGWFVYRRSQVVEALAVWGARIQVATGLVLVGIAEALATQARPVNHAKVGVKLVIALAVVAVYEIANARARKKSGDVGTLVTAGAGLTLANILVATLW